MGRLAYERRFAHLDEEELRDFRAQFGNTWDMVATMLGHRSPETTRQHYLNSRELHQVGEKSLAARSGATLPRSFEVCGVAA